MHVRAKAMEIELIFLIEITSAYISASSFIVLDTNFSVALSNEMNVVESVLLSTWTCILYLFQLQSC